MTGVQTCALPIYGLNERGYSIHIVSLTNDNNNNKRYYLNEEITIQYLFENIKLNYKKNFLKISNAINNYFLQHEYDVIIVSGMDFVPFFCFYYRKKNCVKMIAWEHSNYTIGNKFGLRSLGRRFASRNFDVIVVLTDRDVGLYREGIKKIKSKLLRIYNPIENYREEIKYSSSSKVLISCGALIWQKGFDYAVDIADIIFKKKNDWKWFIYGEGSERPKLEKKIAEKGLTDYLILKGYTDNIKKVYGEASLFILPSRFEGFCMVNLEAMKMNLPVIAFNINCGPDEIIMNGINGYIIDDFNIIEMANKILFLMDKTEERKRMSENCKKSLYKIGRASCRERVSASV